MNDVASVAEPAASASASLFHVISWQGISKTKKKRVLLTIYKMPSNVIFVHTLNQMFLALAKQLLSLKLVIPS